MLSMYPACFFHEDDAYSVVFPDLNWLSTCGDNLEDAMTMAIDCLAGYIYSCRETEILFRNRPACLISILEPLQRNWIRMPRPVKHS